MFEAFRDAIRFYRTIVYIRSQADEASKLHSHHLLSDFGFRKPVKARLQAKKDAAVLDHLFPIKAVGEKKSELKRYNCQLGNKTKPDWDRGDSYMTMERIFFSNDPE